MMQKIKLFVLLVGAVGAAYILNYNCIFMRLTGISCPGCGFTRSLTSLVQFEFLDAFAYYPAIVVVLTLLFAVFFVKKVPNFFYIVCAVVAILIYIFRMFT